jgi:hypothetical protein
MYLALLEIMLYDFIISYIFFNEEAGEGAELFVWLRARFVIIYNNLIPYVFIKRFKCIHRLILIENQNSFEKIDVYIY